MQLKKVIKQIWFEKKKVCLKHLTSFFFCFFFFFKKKKQKKSNDGLSLYSIALLHRMLMNSRK